jgi:hypothetical protein
MAKPGERKHFMSEVRRMINMLRKMGLKVGRVEVDFEGRKVSVATSDAANTLAADVNEWDATPGAA